MVTKRKPSPLRPPSRPLLALGLEGSANKLGVGLILHSPPADHDLDAAPTAIGDLATTSILSNIRHTYVTPPGEGFLPSDTARHHKRWVADVVEKALQEAQKTMHDVDVVCFTKGESTGRFGSKTCPTDVWPDNRTGNGCSAADSRARRTHARPHVRQAPRRSQSLRRP